MNSKEYWKKRFLADKAGTINRSERFIREKTNKYYKQALKEIQEEIEQFYKKFADKNKISLTEAKKIIQASDFKKVDFESMVKTQIHRNQELKQQMNKLPVDVAALIEKQHTRYEKMLAGFTKKGQITRLELLQVNIEKILLDLYDVQQVNIYEHLAKEYEDSYYKGIFNTQQAMGFGKDFTAINKKAVDQAILNTYNRRNYSKTIWGHRQALTEDLRSNIVTGLIQGASMERMASRISKRLDVSRSNAYRLIRTETAYIHEQATKKHTKRPGYKNTNIWQRWIGKPVVCVKDWMEKSLI